MYRKKFYFILVSGIYALILLIWIRRITKESLVTYSTKLTGRMRSIILWEQYSNDSLWQLPSDQLGPDYFNEQKCKVTNCSITIKSSEKGFPFADVYDAIVIPIRAGHAERSVAIPTVRQPWQIYIFALHESPVHMLHDLKSEKSNFYNATMTYRLDSDIVWSDRHFLEIETDMVIAPRMSPEWRKPPAIYYDDEIASLMRTRTKLAAFIASDCGVILQRDVLVYHLQKYIAVDAFNKCGNVICEQNTIECTKLLHSNYKFLFAFENALCEDYVTRKFYLAFDQKLVPVVFGGADYNRFAPLHSYIDAEKFENVAKLAEYLKYLDEHPDEYMRYFWWKKYYKLGQHSIFCDLCEYLHSPGANSRSQSYHDIGRWWFSNSCYVEPKIFAHTAEAPNDKMTG